jgi:hypothetical protein
MAKRDSRGDILRLDTQLFFPDGSSLKTSGTEYITIDQDGETLGDAHHNRIVLIDVSSGDININLPPLSSKLACILIKKHESSNKIILHPDGSEKVNNQSSYDLEANYGSIFLFSGDVEWLIVAAANLQPPIEKIPYTRNELATGETWTVTIPLNVERDDLLNLVYKVTQVDESLDMEDDTPFVHENPNKTEFLDGKFVLKLVDLNVVHDYAVPGDYSYDSAQLELFGGVARLKYVGGEIIAHDYETAVDFSYDDQVIEITQAIPKKVQLKEGLFPKNWVSHFYNTPGNYDFVSTEIELLGGLVQLKYKGQGSIVEKDFTVPGDYTFDPTQIEIISNNARLKQRDSEIIVQNFETPGDYTVENGIEIVSNKAKLIENIDIIHDYEDEAEYTHDNTKTEIDAGNDGLFKLKEFSTQDQDLVVADFEEDTGYDYNNAVIEVDAGNNGLAQLKLLTENEQKIIDQDYETPGDYSLSNSSEIEVASGKLQLIDPGINVPGDTYIIDLDQSDSYIDFNDLTDLSSYNTWGSPNLDATTFPGEKVLRLPLNNDSAGIYHPNPRDLGSFIGESHIYMLFEFYVDNLFSFSDTWGLTTGDMSNNHATKNIFSCGWNDAGLYVWSNSGAVLVPNTTGVLVTGAWQTVIFDLDGTDMNLNQIYHNDVPLLASKFSWANDHPAFGDGDPPDGYRSSIVGVASKVAASWYFRRTSMGINLQTGEFPTTKPYGYFTNHIQSPYDVLVGDLNFEVDVPVSGIPADYPMKSSNSHWDGGSDNLDTWDAYLPGDGRSLFPLDGQSFDGREVVHFQTPSGQDRWSACLKDVGTFSNKSNIWCEVIFYHNGLNAAYNGSNHYMRISFNTGSKEMELSFLQTKLMYINSSSIRLEIGTDLIPENNWHKILINLDLTTTNGTIKELWVNDVKIIDPGSPITDCMITSALRPDGTVFFFLMNQAVANQGNCYIDSFKLGNDRIIGTNPDNLKFLLQKGNDVVRFAAGNPQVTTLDFTNANTIAEFQTGIQNLAVSRNEDLNIYAFLNSDGTEPTALNSALIKTLSDYATSKPHISLLNDTTINYNIPAGKLIFDSVVLDDLSTDYNLVGNNTHMFCDSGDLSSWGTVGAWTKPNDGISWQGETTIEYTPSVGQLHGHIKDIGTSVSDNNVWIEFRTWFENLPNW